MPENYTFAKNRFSVKSIFLVFFLFFVTTIGFSQLTLSVTSNKVPLYSSDGDTLSLCRDSILILKALVKDGTDTLQNNYIKWYFDDGKTEEGTDLDSVSHVYSVGGGYRIRTEILTEDNRKIQYISPIKIAMLPNFSETKTDIPETQDGVCKGSQVLLIGKAYPAEWNATPEFDMVESTAVRISDTEVYESKLFFDEFLNNAIFEAKFLDSIILNLEHSDVGSLKIELTCPTGKTLIIKDFSETNNSYFGQPADNELMPNEIGTGYTYYFSESAETQIPSLSANVAIPGGSYQPQSDFSILNTCALNGYWTLKITDNSVTDNGFIFSWGLEFDKAIRPIEWKFADTLSKSDSRTDDFYILNTFWEREGTHDIAGTGVQFLGDTVAGYSEAYPNSYGDIEYKFHVINNWGCPQDTTYTVKVEKPSFTATPSSGNAELDVSFENTTTWAVTSEWDFDHNSAQSSENSATYLYKEKGDYKVLLTVTDGKECEDTVSQTLKVTVEPSSIENSQNVFTPNDDGVNDFFKVEVNGMETFRISIYNRWGELMYSTENEDDITDIGWDGRSGVANLRASPGVYFYVIKAKGKDGIEYKEKGSVTLFR